MTVWPSGSTTIPRVTDEFGWRVNPITGAWSMHNGIDIIGFYYNRAPKAGVVILASYNGGAGNEVRIRADNGDVFRILHNASFLVGYGERVSEGQPVGVMGTTGDSTGVHCHFETKPGGGVAIDPRIYMSTALATAGSVGVAIKRRKNTVNLFHELGSSPTLYALAGGSPGTPANWLETYDQSFANQLSAQIGASSAGLTSGSFAAWKAAYLAPVKVGGLDLKGITVEAGDDKAVLAALATIATGQNALLAAVKALNPPG